VDHRAFALWDRRERTQAIGATPVADRRVADDDFADRPNRYERSEILCE
jgi:hypothetical protein